LELIGGSTVDVSSFVFAFEWCLHLVHRCRLWFLRGSFLYILFSGNLDVVLSHLTLEVKLLSRYILLLLEELEVPLILLSEWNVVLLLLHAVVVQCFLLPFL